MERLIKSGTGWRIGWNPMAEQFKGLVGTDDWSLELTEAEFSDFCRLLNQLVHTITTMQAELMDEEAIAVEVESDLLWLEAEGYPHAYTLHLILLTGRRGEGCWQSGAIMPLWQAVQSIQVF
ncbi:protein of unknown function DUF1818 [Leptolyngbyaceae cyanobacterium JSC-12]|nr:protein of unknown function DUF1818 [Leptolyngbyaceae cyanobacterium JSC-12]